MNKQAQKELLEIVKRNYDKIAADFSETRKKYLWPELIKLTKIVKNGDKILDAGCGNGRLLKAFAGKGIEYLGVDDSKELINIAREQYPEQRFYQGNILELGKISEAEFDFVFCVAVLHHLPGQNLRIVALKQLKNKVKPDGKIIITVWNLWSQKKFQKLILKFLLLKLIRKNIMDVGDIIFNWKNSQGEQKGKRYYHAFYKKEIKKIIKKAGLKIEKLYKDQYNYYIIIKR